MAITSRPQDKHALLFTGTTASPYMRDIENVYQVLTQYYNYPPTNITLVFGAPPPSTSSFPGSTVVTITTATQLDGALATFADAASGPASGLPALSTSALLYFTGGVDPASHDLATSDSATPDHFDPPWLRARLGAFTACHLHVVMQQRYGGRYQPALTGSGLGNWSFTAADVTGEYSPFDWTDGGYFTQGWVKALKLELLPDGNYADTLGPGAEATDLLVSLREAQLGAKQVQDLLAADLEETITAAYDDAGGVQHLGLPAFLIRDGVPSWWESADIYLTHPNHSSAPTGHFYIPDLPGAVGVFNNTIHVDVRNVGTHPVRRYSLGIELFRTGAGVTNVQVAVPDITPLGGVLLPMALSAIGTSADRKDTYSWNTAFTQGITHLCVKADAERLSSGITFSWDILADDFEAQANTDEMPIALRGAEDAASAEDAIDDLRGRKVHHYGLVNRSSSRRRFLLVFPPRYEELAREVNVRWFAAGKDKKSERAPLEIEERPVRHIPFTLEAGEARDLVVEVRVDRRFEGKEIRLPFEIVAEIDHAEEGAAPPAKRALRESDKRAFAPRKIRWPEAKELAEGPRKLAAIAGVTIVVRISAATLGGRVLSAHGKPVARARVVLQTAGGLQGATRITDAEGRYAFTGINPDVYNVVTELAGQRSPERMVALFPGKEEILDLRHDELRACME